MNKIQTITAILRDLAVIGLILSLGWYIPKAVGSINAASAAGIAAADQINQLVQVQVQSYDTEKNRKAIEAGIQLAAAIKGTINLVNTTTIKKLNTAVDELAETTRVTRAGIDRNLNTSNKLMETIGPLVTETSVNVNGLLVNTNGTVLSLQELLNTTKEKTNLTLDQINGIISSSEWNDAIKHINESTANIELLTAELKAAGASAPSIAKSMEEIAKTSSKYRKAVLLSQIISAIGRAFF